MYDQISPNLKYWIVEHNVSIIHLFRRNILKTIISRETMKARGVAHITVKETVEDIKIELNVDKLVPNISAIERQIHTQIERFSMLPYLEVSYEDFVNDPSGSAAQIFDFLGTSNVGELELPLKKINKS